MIGQLCISKIRADKYFISTGRYPVLVYAALSGLGKRIGEWLLFAILN